MLKAHLIVNVYNGERYLAETLDALVSQDYSSVLIHCIDNHSTDSTAEILASFMSNYNNMIVYQPPKHMPLVDARLFALDKIKETYDYPFYFSFSDADDLCEPNWVSKLMAFANLNYDVLISNGYSFKGEKYTPVNSCLSQLRPSPFICPVYLRSCLFSSSIVDGGELMFDNQCAIIYDTEFWIRRGASLSYLHISDRLFYKRIHSESLGNTNFLPVLREQWKIRTLHRLSIGRFLYGFFRQILNKVM